MARYREPQSWSHLLSGFRLRYPQRKAENLLQREGRASYAVCHCGAKLKRFQIPQGRNLCRVKGQRRKVAETGSVARQGSLRIASRPTENCTTSVCFRMQRLRLSAKDRRGKTPGEIRKRTLAAGGSRCMFWISTAGCMVMNGGEKPKQLPSLFHVCLFDG